MDPSMIQDGSKREPRWYQDGSKVDPSMIQEEGNRRTNQSATPTEAVRAARRKMAIWHMCARFGTGATLILIASDKLCQQRELEMISPKVGKINS